MLVLSRKIHQAIVIGADIRVTVVSTRGRQIRLGIEAPSEVVVHREELLRRPAPDPEEAPLGDRPA
jgi:carbon storage regulator